MLRPGRGTRGRNAVTALTRAAAQSCDHTAETEVPGFVPGTDLRPPTSSPPSSTIRTPPWTSRSALRTRIKLAQTARDPASRPKLAHYGPRLPSLLRQSISHTPILWSACGRPHQDTLTVFFALSVNQSRANAISSLLRSCSRDGTPASPCRFGKRALRRLVPAGPSRPCHSSGSRTSVSSWRSPSVSPASLSPVQPAWLVSQLCVRVCSQPFCMAWLSRGSCLVGSHGLAPARALSYLSLLLIGLAAPSFSATVAPLAWLSRAALQPRLSALAPPIAARAPLHLLLGEPASLITAPMNLTSLLSFVASVELARVPPVRLLARMSGTRPKCAWKSARW